MKAKTKKSWRTRQRILQAARELFNRQGTREVTTHDIARAADLSPGNLYYHFSSKAEIVSAIFVEMELFSPESWTAAISQNELGSFHKFIEFFFSQLSKYRFFFREQAELLHADPLLASKWQESHRTIASVMRAAADHWVQLGILKKFESEAEVDAFIANSWIIISFSHSFFESQGESSIASLEGALNRQLASFLKPYHTAKGKKLLDQYFAHLSM